MAPPSNDGSRPISPLHHSPALPFEVRPVDYATAKEMIETYHYSNKMPHGKNTCFGAYIEGELYAVAVYGVGVNMVAETYLARITGLPVVKENLSELKRLARKGERGESRVSLTRFLAICHRMLAKTGIRFIYSFSDPMHSHDGTIYRAANFLLLGQTQAEVHYQDATGKVIHRRVPYRLMQNTNVVLVQKDPERKSRFLARCEAERQSNDERKHLGRKWPCVTREIMARQAKAILQEEGQDFYTFDRARVEMGITKLKTEAKNRWFLPLVGKDRNQLTNGGNQLILNK